MQPLTAAPRCLPHLPHFDARWLMVRLVLVLELR